MPNSKGEQQVSADSNGNPNCPPRPCVGAHGNDSQIRLHGLRSDKTAVLHRAGLVSFQNSLKAFQE